MPEAIQALLQHDQNKPQTPAPIVRESENPAEARRLRRSIGTPGMQNRPLKQEPGSTLAYTLFDRKEQAPTDRQPPRRGEHFDQQPRHPAAILSSCAETPAMRMQARRAGAAYTPVLHQAALPEKSPAFSNNSEPKRLETASALNQAMRAADLLLSAGGFAALVLDLGSTLPQLAGRIPMATWFRFRAAAERSRTTILLLTQNPCAGSSAGLVLRLKASNISTEGDLFTGRTYEVAISRQRFEAVEEQPHDAEKVIAMRKPPQSERCATWSRTAAWAPYVKRVGEKVPS